MGKNPISHTLAIKALKEENPHILPSLLKTLGGVRRDARRQNREKVHQLSRKARCSSKTEKGKNPKRSQHTKVWKKDGGRKRSSGSHFFEGGIPQLRDQPERLRGNCPAYKCTGQNP